MGRVRVGRSLEERRVLWKFLFTVGLGIIYLFLWSKCDVVNIISHLFRAHHSLSPSGALRCYSSWVLVQATETYLWLFYNSYSSYSIGNIWRQMYTYAITVCYCVCDFSWVTQRQRYTRFFGWTPLPRPSMQITTDNLISGNLKSVGTVGQARDLF